MSRPGPLTLDWHDVETLSIDLVVPWSKRLMSFHKDPGGTTYTTYGTAAPTTSGTLSNLDDADGPWMGHASATPTGSSAGFYTAYTIVRRDWSPSCVFRFRSGNASTTLRYWMGFFSADPSAAGALGTIHGAAFGYDTVVDGTAYWRSVTSDGSSSTRTATSVAYSTSTPYTMRIDLSSGAARFWINGNLVNQHTANLPSATQLMGWACFATTLGVGVSRRITLGRVAIVHI